MCNYMGLNKMMSASEWQDLVNSGKVDVEKMSPLALELDKEYIDKVRLDILKKEVLETGLFFNYRYGSSVLFDLLTYTKKDFDMATSLFKEIRMLREKESMSFLYQAIFGNSSNVLDVIKGNMLRGKYADFFKAFEVKYDEYGHKIKNNKGNDFFHNLDRYTVLMSFIFNELKGKSLNEREQFLDKVYDNFLKIDKLGIKKVYVKLLEGNFEEKFTLDGYPLGIIKYIFPFKHLYYREENLFTDGEVTDSYNEEDDIVDVLIDKPSFVIKSGRSIGDQFALEDGEYDLKYYSITVYDLDFDSSKLPTFEELQDTRCSLKSYDYMMDMKKLEQIKQTLEQVYTKTQDLHLVLKRTLDILDNFDIEMENDNILNIFSSEEMRVLNMATLQEDVLKGKVLTKRRKFNEREK